MDSEDLKRSISMRELVESYGIKVNNKGFCCCPFHKEKTPSMKIYKDSYHCFGCNASGDIFSFVQQFECVSFKEAYKRLGGTYRHVETLRDKLKADVEKRKFEEQKRARKRAEARLKRDKLLLITKITALKEVKAAEEPGSNAWHYCENQLLQSYDILNDYIEKGVNIYE